MSRYLNEVETDVLVEGIQYECCQAVVAPRAVHQQQPVQKPELEHDGNDRGQMQKKMVNQGQNVSVPALVL